MMRSSMKRLISESKSNVNADLLTIIRAKNEGIDLEKRHLSIPDSRKMLL